MKGGYGTIGSWYKKKAFCRYHTSEMCVHHGEIVCHAITEKTDKIHLPFTMSDLLGFSSFCAVLEM